MVQGFEEEIREFLIESSENLASLDREIVALEENPGNAGLISSVFRTIHTIKGTCGFFGFENLGSVAHVTENILSQVRDGERELTPPLISLILEAVDTIRALLTKIEAEGSEGEDDCGELRSRLAEAHLARSLKAREREAMEPETVELEAGKIDTPPKPRPADPRAPHQHSLDQHASGRHSPGHHSLGHPPPAERQQPGKSAHSSEPTIRVDVALLDRLMNLVGELVLVRNQLVESGPARPKTLQRLSRITAALQDGVMKARMQPVGVVWNRLPRMVRDLAAKCGKKVRLEMEGAETELDRTILEAIGDPLTHIVRNACDHGIETPEVRAGKKKDAEGLLRLRAYHDGGIVNLEISDDGGGIDPEKLKRKALEKGLLRPEEAAQMSDHEALHLIFLPGLSTAAEVTGISGRGVGMDVVRTNIERIGGSAEVRNGVPHGTVIRIRIPLTLAIIPGLVVSLHAPAGGERKENGSREQRFVIPQVSLLELVHLEGAKELRRIDEVHGAPIFHYRGALLPLIRLDRILGRAATGEAQPGGGEGESGAGISIVVLQAGGCPMALVVDRIHDTREIVVKPLGRLLKGLACYAGATIMGDGRPALILDVAGLARLAGLARRDPLQPRPQASPENAVQPVLPAAQMLLLFRIAGFERIAVPLSYIARLEEIETAKIERAAGRPVLHYRGGLLPLVSLRALLAPQLVDEKLADESLSAKTMQVVIFTDGARQIGMIVDRILDIVHEPVTMQRGGPIRGLLGSAVIGGRVTDLLDLRALIELAGEHWPDLVSVPQERRRTLLLDSSSRLSSAEAS